MRMTKRKFMEESDPRNEMPGMGRVVVECECRDPACPGWQWKHRDEVVLRVRDLVKYLMAYPPDMVLVETRCSDLGYMSLDSWNIVDAVEVEPGHDGWLRRLRAPDLHTDPEAARAKKYVHYAGN